MFGWSDKQLPPWPALCLACLLIGLSGCSGSPNYAPVVDRSGLPQTGDGRHVVRSGETLYAIAWRYGVDFRALAAANHLRAPYTIYPGQTLRLGGSPAAVAQTTGAPAQRRETAAAKPAPRAPAAKGGAGGAAPAAKAPAPSAPQAARLGAWRWPATGPVIRRFSTAGSSSKGIDLRGELGQPVLAANAGQVVYAGSGLVGYGNLIIIKHDDQYLSAYGHNSKLLVEDGQRVKAGQKIAEIGDTGTNSMKLHFQVRRSGQPIDPLSVLPKR